MENMLLKIRYPKLLGLLATVAVAYFAVSESAFDPMRIYFQQLGYIGTLFAGILFTYGFTAAPATAMFATIAKQQNIFIAAAIGGIGALIGDMLIFKILRHSFKDEIDQLSKERPVAAMGSAIPTSIRGYIMPILGGFIIASPLPDEIGVGMLAASTNISGRAFTIFSFLLNSAGILAILILAGGL
ncbi:MAG TPA: hypothetical protein HA254_05470 [Candidatus Diapherotrites archaeon]|uniref:VTT domain-containing protein n=1 Tax=Candidatus Iainarchaeum sp. TaxID=3101447 RepID=A0A7J4J213_9ARCH|nr:hypothetical protein [Candidatus Diapherotrites archaeon]